MLRPNPVGLIREILALVHEGMRQVVCAKRVGVTRATVNGMADWQFGTRQDCRGPTGNTAH